MCASVSANSLDASNVCQRSCAEASSLDRPIDKIINTRNAIIALFIMLILLLTLQAPVFFDDIVTSRLTLAPAAEQALRPVHLQSMPVNNPTTMQVLAITEAPIVQSEKAKTDLIEPAKDQQAIVKLVSAETAISIPAQFADVSVLELAAIAPASGPRQPETAANEDIKADAAKTFATIIGNGFVKIANTGEALDDDAAKWECVEDKNNSLVWEVKKNDGGIRDKAFSYSWLHNMNGENIGKSNGGRCKGSVSCDTSSFVRAINEQKLCGYTDWRLPAKEELETLVEYNDNPKEATINKAYFPEAIPSWYWTASENPQREGYAWYVLFRNGIALNDLKERPKHIRLVRGTIQQ